MDLLERYLAAIARNLPDAQKADVTAELRDVLMSQVEEAESAAGRPLNREEMEALLVRFGHPLTVSGRYRKVQHLIGPEVFPFWWAGIKVSLSLVFGIYMVLAVLVAIAGEDIATINQRGAPELSSALIFTFGIVTLVCALIERFGKATMLTKWNPRQLPPVKGPARSRFELVVEIGMGIVAILWWIGLIRFWNAIPSIGLKVELAPVWQAWFWPILAYLLFELGSNTFALVRPGQALLARSLMLVRNVAAISILSVILQAGHWIVVTSTMWRPIVQEEVQANFDAGMRIGISATIALFAALAAVDIWRIVQMVRIAGGDPARA